MFDINSAVAEIDSFFEAGKKIFENYRKDLKTKRAVEWNLKIIGKAVKRILDKDDRIYLTNARKIIEQGTHQELLDKKGVYKKLYDLQAFE